MTAGAWFGTVPIMPFVNRGPLVAALVVVLMGCAAPASPAPSAEQGATSASDARSPSPGATTAGSPAATDAAGSVATPGPPSTTGSEGVPTFADWPSDWTAPPDVQLVDPDADPGPATLPEPAPMEPFAIGEALYDPERVPVAFVSLLDQMGIGIYAADGSPIRRGDERSEDDLRLDERIVASLIDKGVDDAAAATDEGDLPFSFRDLADALAPLVPGWSADRLATAYDDVYRDHPDGLVAQAMLGQPIEPSTPLTRLQIWLLFVDGFVTPAAVAAASGVSLAANGANWGQAAAALPSLADQQARDTALLMGLDGLISFAITPSTSAVHEGHGGPGPSVVLTATVGPARSSPGIPFAPRPTANISTLGFWAGDHGFLTQHGTIATPLGEQRQFRGQDTFRYQVRREPGQATGPVVSKATNVTMFVNFQELVAGAYQVPAAQLDFLQGYAKSASARIRVAWHGDEGVRLQLQNEFHLMLGDGEMLPPEMMFGVPLAGSAEWDGTDSVSGFLERLDDGTYLGRLVAAVEGAFVGSYGGFRCALHYRGSQSLDVNGREIQNGLFLQLTFVPASAPQIAFRDDPAEEKCEDENWYVQRGGRTYLPFGTGHWTSAGYAVANPDRFTPEWHYEDTEDDDPADDAGFGTWTWRVDTERIAADP